MKTKIAQLFVCLSLGICWCADAENTTTVSDITVSDLTEKRFRIIGLLGVPIGSTVEVQCQFEKSTAPVAKSTRAGTLRVLSIAGRVCGRDAQPTLPMEHVVSVLDRCDEVLLKGDVVTCRVFEGIQTVGIPEDAFGGRSPVAVSRAWGVYSMLNVVDARKRPE